MEITSSKRSQEPSAPRFSTTIIMLRKTEKNAPFEVLLVKRAQTLRVLPGFMVFPGGVIEENDLQVAQTWLHRKPLLNMQKSPLGDTVPIEFVLEGAQLFGRYVERTELYWALFATGLREMYEETGILMLDKQEQIDFVPSEQTSNETAVFLPAEQLWNQVAMRTQSLPYTRYFGRRVTPPEVKFRYDAHYFLCLAPEVVPLQLRESEIESATWLTPEEILIRFHANSLLMAPPTVDAIMALAQYASLDELLTQGFMPPQVYDEKRIRDFISRI